jgi:probable HAF family extracellular repeat protein
MKARHSTLTRTAGAAVIALATFTVSCRESDEPTAPPVEARVSTGNPTVSSVVPDSSPRGVTLDITVNGSGFNQGSVVTLQRQGVPAGSITTNTTTYVTSRKLIANITIAADADTGKYDVAVTTSDDRKGVGIELFTVTYVMDELGIIGGTWSRAYAINDRGEAVGASCTQDCLGTAFYWSEATGQVDLGRLPGYTRSAAYAINNRGQAFGVVECWSGDATCGGVYKQQLVRWDKVGGSWTITPLEGCSVARDGTDHFPINNNDECVRWKPESGDLVVQTLSGVAVVSEEPLPSLEPGGLDGASAITDARMVAGWAFAGGLSEPVIWYRSVAGAWVILRLGFPGSDNIGRALDIGEPDAGGRVRVSGMSGIQGAHGGYRAVRWTLQADGLAGWRVASIEALEYAQARASDAWGRAVNNAGDVVGHSDQQAVKWPVGGGVQTLPLPGGGASGRATDINDQGWIVGAVWDNHNQCDRAAIWRQR